MKISLSKSEKNHLNKTIQFRNESVILRFQSENGLSYKESVLIFKDLLYFLWLTNWAKQQNQKKVPNKVFIGIRSSLLILDEMWHTFVLYSRSYEKFCKDFFGQHIYHNPGPSFLEINNSKRPMEASNTENVWRKQKQITLSLLGRTVHKRWYVYYKKFTFVKIKELQLRSAKTNYDSNLR
jgi:hypothetical protein